LRLIIFFFLLSTVAIASAVNDPLALNFTGDIDELQQLLAGEVIGFVNRSAGEGIFNQTSRPARADPPFYHLMKNDTMFRDFENLTGPVEGISFSVNDSWNESFFERLIQDWW
jgi:hypothetical protein